MGVAVVSAEQRHVVDVYRVCADGWRETYAGILPDEEIEAPIE